MLTFRAPAAVIARAPMTLFREEPDLLRRFRAGEKDALERVYWTYVERVETIIRRGWWAASGARVPGAPPAEVADLVHEVFVRAFTHRLGYDGLREYAPFIGTIARNVLATWARSRGKVAELPADGDLAPAPVDDEPAWASEAVTRVVERYLGALPPALAGVHRERFALGHSQEAAAANLGLTRQRVRTLEHKLRRGLDKALRKAQLREPS
jgi:RNA polymerase sigma factor (sigma-70 family)